MAPDPGHRTQDAARRPRLIQNAVIGVALLAELIALLGHVAFDWGPGPPPLAATPPPLAFQPALPPSGAELLVRMADISARRPDPPAARFAHVVRRTWQLQVGNPASPPTEVIPSLVSSWLAPDGTGEITTAASGSRRHTARLTSVAAAPLPSLPPDAAVLAARLGFSGRPGDGSAAQFDAFVALAEREPLMPRVRAVLELLLARIPDLVDSGAVLDRAGRSGVAVAIDAPAPGGQRVRTVLIFDPVTGALLETDKILISEPGRLPVHEGAVLGYTTFLQSGYTTAAP